MDSLELSGRKFRVEIEHDSDMGAPWEEHDGHGPVSDWTSRDKSAGELVLSSDGRRGFKRFYDFAEACRIARADGWGFVPGELKTFKTASGTWRAWVQRKPWETGDNFESESADINEAIGAVYAKHRATMTARQYAAGAAMRDFERLKDWCADRWHWCGVVVTLLDSDGDETGETESLWGIESDSSEYLKEVAQDLAEEILHRVTDQEAEEMEESRPDMQPAPEGVEA